MTDLDHSNSFAISDLEAVSIFTNQISSLGYPGNRSPKDVMQHLFPIFVLGFLVVAGCSGPRLRVKADSPLKEAIDKFSNEWEESPTSWGIRDQIYTVLPPGSSESKVIEHIKLHFVDGPGSPERIFGQADQDYFYRVEGFRNRVEVWYRMKDGKLVKIEVANMRCSM